jgi:hypothetical protein
VGIRSIGDLLYSLKASLEMVCCRDIAGIGCANRGGTPLPQLTFDTAAL